jgi:AraC family transcriptional regulator
MEPDIVTLGPKVLVGMRIKMSMSKNTTADLWRSFMPKRKFVEKKKSGKYYSMQVYPEGEKEIFSPETLFEKWAAVEVSAKGTVPECMEVYNLRGGKYAVFIHNGPASTFPKTMQYIMNRWLPESEYELDNREFFEVLPESYDPQDTEAKEEVWIPVRNR